MSLLDILQPIPNGHIHPDTIAMLDAHQTVLGTQEVSVLAVSAQLNEKHLGNFWGLLDDLQVDKKYHWLIANLNGIRESGDYQGNLGSILVPDLRLVEATLRLNRSSKTL